MNARLSILACLAALAAVAGRDARAQNAAEAAALIPDTPEFLRIAADCGAARRAVDQSRRAELGRLIQVQIDEAEALLKEKKRVGNITGIAVAMQARQLFEEAMAQLNSNGTFQLPGRVRRELDDTVRHFNSVCSGIEARASNDVARIQKDHFERLKQELARLHPDRQSGGLEAAFAALVDRLMAPPPPEQPDTRAAGTNGAASTNEPSEASAAAAAPPELPEILGESGAASRWVTVGRMTADMMSVDVLTFSLPQLPAGTNRSETFNPITQQSSAIEYVTVHALQAPSGLVYRLKRLPDREGVQILDWPSPRNGFTLTVRTMPSPAFPKPHGFEVQAGGAEALLTQRFAGASIESLADATATQEMPIVVTVISKPAGAAVLVDGALVRGVKTPCRLRLPPATQSLRLVLPGHLDGVLSSREITAGGTLSWTFSPDPRIIRKTVVVPADTARWVSVGNVEAGARISLDVQGSWSCTGGRMTGPEGYPNNEANYTLYMNPADYPRQLSSAGYGALLWRIAPRGRPAAAGKALRTIAREAGTLELDINEAPEPARRADNTGALSVSVLIVPGAAP